MGLQYVCSGSHSQIFIYGFIHDLNMRLPGDFCKHYIKCLNQGHSSLYPLFVLLYLHNIIINVSTMYIICIIRFMFLFFLHTVM